MTKTLARLAQRLRCWKRGHRVVLLLDGGTVAFQCVLCGNVSTRVHGTFDPWLVHEVDDQTGSTGGALRSTATTSKN